MVDSKLKDRDLLDPPEQDGERSALSRLDPPGFFIRHPAKPHMLDSFITPDDQLFQTIHMGPAVVDTSWWRLVIAGLVRSPFALTFDSLCKLPRHTVTAFHECYGPTKPATTALWRVGNVRWTGVPLRELLSIAKPLREATFVWSESLGRGEFHGVQADRYQKDLPMEKAVGDDVLLAYEMNGRPLSRDRGGPVRLVVPGWFETNSTKWMSKIILQDHRAEGPFTTRFYNEPDPGNFEGSLRPAWRVEPNSMILKPKPGERLQESEVQVEGWAWGNDPVHCVQVSFDGGQHWAKAALGPRVQYSWQKSSVVVCLDHGPHTILARATSNHGVSQPLTGRRNYCHSVVFEAGNDSVQPS